MRIRAVNLNREQIPFGEDDGISAFAGFTFVEECTGPNRYTQKKKFGSRGKVFCDTFLFCLIEFTKFDFKYELYN